MTYGNKYCSDFSSETALTWFAMDFTDDPAGQVEKLAVKFKLAETKDEFKKAFESAQAKLKSGPAPQAADSSATASIIVERAKPAKVSLLKVSV